MMTIAVEGIKLYAYHGHLKEEAVLGGHFSVSVWVDINTEIVEELSLPPVKIHCSVLAEDAIKAAISDYKSRNKE